MDIKNETINNATVLLEECLYNGAIGPENLYAWFIGEKEFIEGTLQDLMFYVKPRKGPFGGPTPY